MSTSSIDNPRFDDARSSRKCERCARRPARHPRRWYGATVSGPALCAPCARELSAARAWRREEVR